MPPERSSRPPVRPRGRPRSRDAEDAVREAARAIFEEQGYAGVTVEAIAARSGVAKTTIYRRWPDRVAVLVDVLTEAAAATIPTPTGQDPVRALRREVRRVASAANAFPGRLLMALLGHAQHDPAIRDAFLTRLFEPRHRASADAIRRAQALGTIRREVDADLATDLFFGPLFFRMLVRHAPPSEAFAEQTFRYAMEGLGRQTGPSTRKARSRSTRGSVAK